MPHFSYHATFCHHILSILCLLMASAHTSPSTPAIQLQVKQIERRHDADWVRDIQCYNLPYGLVGFINHLLTYYSVTVLHFQRKPLWPFEPLSNDQSGPRTSFNRTLPVLQGVVTTSLALYNLSQCHKRWPLDLVFIWKVVFTFLNAVWSYYAQHRARHPFPSTDEKIRDWAKYCIAGVYAVDTFVGFVGLCGVMRGAGYGKTQQIITGAFAAPWLLVSPVIMVVTKGRNMAAVALGSLFYLLVAVPVLFALYSDWIIGTLIGDVYGFLQNPGSVTYWAYFAFKRLPLLTT